MLKKINEVEKLLDLIDDYASLHTENTILRYKELGLPLYDSDKTSLQKDKETAYTAYHLDSTRKKIKESLLPKETIFTFKNLTILVAIFNFVILSVRAFIAGDILSAGLAGIYPLLIYLIKK